MGARVRAFDWSTTPLGRPDAWPHSLRLAVGVCLNSRFPMFVWWGPDLINIYNDAYIPVLGNRHPDALGRPARATWNEIWPVVGPQADAVMRRGQATWNERVLLVMERNGYTEDTWFTWSYSPIYDESGGIGGVFCACTEDTPRVLAERERDHFARQRQLALDAAQMGWWHFDPATGITDWDPRFAEIFGVTGDRAPDDRVAARIHPDDQPRVRAAVAAALDPGQPQPYSAEYRITRGDGAARWIEAHGVATFTGDGPDRRPTSFVGTVADVTDRRRAEELPRTILESITDAFFAVDRDWRFTYLNRQAERVLGRPPGGLVGKVIWDEYPGLPGSPFELAYRRAAEERVPTSATAYYPDHDRWYEVHAYPAPDGISVYFRDVTEPRRADTALRESEDRFRAAFEQSAVGIVLGDLDGRIQRVNDAFCQIVGRSRDELLGLTSGAFTHPDDVPQNLTILARLKTAGATSNDFEKRYLRKDGSVVHAQISVSAVRDAAGAPVGVIGIVQDVTDRHRAEAERDQVLASERAARADAERASRMKDEFLATLSHELRTPLNAILGWAQILRTLPDPSPDLREGLEVIDRNARAQTQIIEDLLDMSRIVSGNIRLDVQRVDLAPVVRAAIETVRPAADAKGIRIQAVLDPLARPVSGDPSRLQQVFWNLLSNAIKFTPRGGRVQVVLERVNSHLEVSVTDTGEGISPEFLPYVFDRFRQADATTTRRHGGLGLGLAIVKQLAELHGGTVQARSDGPGQGSTFSVLLPLTALHADPEDPGRRHPHSGPALASDEAACAALAGVKVLVVDDEFDARALVRRLLEDCHADVRVAASADEAVRLIEAERPDVLISDIGMPGEDGYSLIQRVRASAADGVAATPALALTAYARAEDRVKAIRAGYHLHVAKPVEPVELITMVASLAGRTPPASPTPT
jgi:PAS domain S-box-containing protein